MFSFSRQFYIVTGKVIQKLKFGFKIIFFRNRAFHLIPSNKSGKDKCIPNM